MTPELVEKLLRLVNLPDNWEALEAYAKYRQELAHRDIVRAEDPRALGQVQGKITELNMLLGLRESVRHAAKQIEDNLNGR